MIEDSPPTVPISFSNNFWGLEEKGVTSLLQRMREAKLTCEELKAFYKERISIEDDYSRRLLSLSRRALGSVEVGTLKASLETVRRETEQMSKAHANTSDQLKMELEEPLIAFAAGMRERRKVVQTTIEKLTKAKMAQAVAVQKNKDRFESDCNKINGYIAQQNMVLGRELEKNNSKLEKVQISVTTSRRDYQMSLRNLAETTERWNREWRAACDKFQDLEEERIDFLKSNIWAYTNVLSTVCVNDDEFCENIRLSLEKCDVEQDIVAVVKDRGTGREIPDPPKYINFMEGSYQPERECYCLAQFPRSGNPQFRSSSPQLFANENQTLSKKVFARNNDQRGNVQIENSHSDLAHHDDHHDLSSIPSDQIESIFNSMAIDESSKANLPRDSSKQTIKNWISSATNSSEQPLDILSENKPINRRIPSAELSKYYAVGGENQETPAQNNSSPDIKSKGAWKSPFKRSSKVDTKSTWAEEEIVTKLPSKEYSTQSKQSKKYGFLAHYARSKSAASIRSNNDILDSSLVDDDYNSSPTKEIPVDVKLGQQNDNKDDYDPLQEALSSLRRGASDKYNGIGSINGSIRKNNGRRVPSYSAPTSPSNSSARPNDISAPSHNSPVNKQSQFRPLSVAGKLDTLNREQQMQYPPRTASPQISSINRQLTGKMSSPALGYQTPSPTKEMRPSSRMSQQQVQQHVTQVQGQAYTDSRIQPRLINGRPPSRAEGIYNESPKYMPSNGYAARPPSAFGQSKIPRNPYEAQLRQHRPEEPIYSDRMTQQRQKSKSALDLRAAPQGIELPVRSRDGREVIAHARAMYDYKAQIPEEVSFRKGDFLLVLNMQEDGWWEAEVFGPRSRPQLGLAPSNFCHVL
ncbi:hypothetical protein V1511DRAFT_517647 [Dipodascopsis uninucleata]